MYDCIIIGAGISGTSLAYQLSQFKGKVLLLEKENDISQGTTKANSGIIHAGYDPQPNTNMAKYNVLGNRLTPQWCKDLDVRIQNVGSLVLAFSDDQIQTLHHLLGRGIQNGVSDLRIVEKEELLQMEPHINPDVMAALYAPTAWIVDPWDLAIACAEVAVENGVEVQLEQEVIGMEKKDDYFLVRTSDHTYEAKIVVNAAGLQCAKVANFLKESEYDILPNKGEYYLLDKNQGHLAHHILFPCPNEKGKGVLVAPTVHGNLIVGPSSQVTEDDQDVSTSIQGLQGVKEKALLSIPSIDFRENIRSFAGLRARRKEGSDFVVGEDAEIENFYQIAAMASPGLSSAVAIAIELCAQFQEKGWFTQPNLQAKTTRKIPRLKEMDLDTRSKWVHEYPEYGRIICRCETISEGEILEALHRPIVPKTIDGIKRRCNAGMGRCQGGFCGCRVQELIAQTVGIPFEEVLQDKKGSRVVISKTKETGDENEV